MRESPKRLLNLVVRKLYVERIQEALLPGYELDRERRAVRSHCVSTLGRTA